MTTALDALATPGLAGARRAGAARAASLPLLTACYVYLLTLYQGGVQKLALLDGDTYWHIAAGRWILQHRAIPTTDVFSHTRAGAPWVPHEWLSEVLMALAHQAAGWTGVVALTGLGFALAVGLLTRALLPSFTPTRVVLLAVVAVMMTVPHMLARPHMLALAPMMLWAVGLVGAADARRAPSLWLLPAMTLWANLHGGFTLGLGLACAFALEAVLDARPRGLLRRAVKDWGLFLALALGASLLTPNGVSGLAMTWQLMVQDQYALSRIGEWASPNFHQFQPLALWLLGGMAVALTQGLRLPPVRLALLLGLVYLSLKHMRNIELLGLLSPLIVARPAQAQWGPPGASPSGARQDGLAPSARAASGRALALALALCATLTVLLAQFRPVGLPETAAPIRALEAARRAGASGPLLNEYSWGGWLIYQGIPVFIDGRADIYRDAFMRTYTQALSLHSTGELEALLARHDIGWTLLAAHTPAIALLDRLPGWHRVYSDTLSVVHARTGQALPANDVPRKE